MYDSAFDGSEQQGSAPHRDRTRSTRRRSRRPDLRNQPWLAVALVVLLAVLLVAALVIGLKGCSSTPSIEGRWDLDGATVYEFYPEGKGALVLTTMKFEFTYTIDGDKVSIDFADERASDAAYEFAVEDDLLMLTGGPDGAQTQYILKRDN